jgi:RHS repeat-associated protein
MRLVWDVEHQLQSATVTKAAHTEKPVTQTTQYRYDAFGRRLGKQDAFGQTRFEWDGNRLLSEQRGSQQTLYIYEADSFAPLAQVQLAAGSSEPKQPLAHVEQAQSAIKLEEPEDEEDWQPRKTASALQAQMLAQQKKLQAQVRGEVPEERPPEQEAELNSNVVHLQDWKVRYYHNDHLGTPRELSSDDGQIVWQATYKAWGNTLKVERPVAEVLQKQERIAQVQQAPEAKNDANLELWEAEQNLRFQGQYFDSETGLHYNRFRYFDPDVGRFISRPCKTSATRMNIGFAPVPLCA